MNSEPSPATSIQTTHLQTNKSCLQIVHDALLDVKAKNIVEFNVSSTSQVCDVILIASGTSTRHVKALADNVVEEAKKAGFRPIGMEGERDAEWILIDLDHIVVHVMLPTTRQFYDLESLWQPLHTEPVTIH